MLNAVSFPYFGKSRNLKIGINAMRDAERELGIGIPALLSGERFGIDAITVLLWAGLKHEDQSLTVNKVGNWIEKYALENDKNLPEVIILFQEKIIEAMKESKLFGDEDLNDEELGNGQTGEVN